MFCFPDCIFCNWRPLFQIPDVIYGISMQFKLNLERHQRFASQKRTLIRASTVFAFKLNT